MPQATSDRPTESSPPRKPRGARWRTWAALLALLPAVYLGCYAALRPHGTLRRSYAVHAYRYIRQRTYPERRDTVVAGGELRGSSPVELMFRPCIAFEVWWRNR